MSGVGECGSSTRFPKSLPKEEPGGTVVPAFEGHDLVPGVAQMVAMVAMVAMSCLKARVEWKPSKTSCMPRFGGRSTVSTDRGTAEKEGEDTI